MKRSDEERIRELAEVWAEAVRAGDVETLLDLVTEDVVFLPPTGDPIRGRPRVGDLYRQAFAQRRLEPSVVVEEVRIFGDHAMSWGTDALTSTPKGGGAPIERSGRSMSVHRRGDDGRWRVSHGINNMVPPRASGPMSNLRATRDTLRPAIRGLVDSGRWTEAEALLRELLCGEPEPKPGAAGSDRALLLADLAEITWKRGAREEAHRLLVEARELALAADDPFALGEVLYGLGELAYVESFFLQTGEPGEARRLHEEGLAARRRAEDRAGEALSLWRIGVIEEREETLDVARTCYEEAIRIAEEIDAPSIVSRAITHLGGLDRRTDDPQQALACYRRALEIDERIDFQQGILSNLTNQAMIRWRMGETPDAILPDLLRALAMAVRSGFGLLEARVRFGLGRVLVDRGDLEAGREHLLETARIAERFDIALLADAAKQELENLGKAADALQEKGP